MAKFTMLIVRLIMFTGLLELVSCSGQFQLQVVSVENTQSNLHSGACCSGGASASPPNECHTQCHTAVALCLKEWSVAAESHHNNLHQGHSPGGTGGTASSSAAAAQLDSPMGHHDVTTIVPRECTYGYNKTGVLGPSSFTLTNPPPQGHLGLKFTFSWTRSFTFILEVQDVNDSNPNAQRSVIESTVYSGMLMPGSQWHTLTHAGPAATVIYRVRVVCDEHYYNTTCNKLCRPRDDQFGHYVCDESGNKVCVEGWTGDTCEKPICKEGCLMDHGDCNQPGECKCRPGWHGELCEQCMPYPGCVHGYCNGRPWTCECHLNWGGILCDRDLNYCGRNPCQNGGTCENTAPDAYNCTCPEGFSGDSCEVVEDPCAVSPCANGGTCMEVSTGYQCTCASGWTGQNCDEDLDDCLSSPCEHNSTCVDQLNGFSCNCSQGWEGNRCQFDSDECQGQPCINAVSCKNLDGDYECECQDGWRGKNCNVNVNDCLGQCLNGGTCIDLVADYHCACTSGFSGKHCEINIDDCASNPCKNGGDCVDQVNGYKCICLVGYSGSQCESDIDLCNPNPCHNGAFCINTPFDYFCYCTEQFFGKNCTQLRPSCDTPNCEPADAMSSCQVPSSGDLDDGCGPHGQCTSSAESLAACNCHAGWTGEFCHINVDDCASNPCKNGATCVDHMNGFQCVCDFGWSGQHCEYDINECQSSPCRHNSTCLDLTGEYKCECRGEWKGRHCTSSSSSHCSQNTCSNGGTCIDHGQDFECICPPGWRGIACQIPTWRPCDSSPCLNEGTCINSGDGYSCACKEGWDSINCEININDCASNPCQNGGKCIDGVNKHHCKCLKGYTGPHCQIKVDSCSSNPCSYGSTCLDLSKGEFLCMCPPGRTGQLCDAVLTANKGWLSSLTGSPRSCLWNGDLRPHGSLWHHHCNTCHCKHGEFSCTNVWCGPQNCMEEKDPATFCSSIKTSVCVSGPNEWCLSPPCDAWGDCRQYDIDGNIGPIFNPGQPDCRPNHAELSNSCARLTVVLDSDRVPAGAHVQRLCAGLREAWAASYDKNRPTPAPIILCSLPANRSNLTNHTIEITLSYTSARDDGSDVTRAARTLAGLLSNKMTLMPALSAVTEVKVETTLITSTSSEAVSTVLVSVTAMLVLVLLVATGCALYWLYGRKSDSKPGLSFSLHKSKLEVDPHIERTNNENEDRLYRYNNSLKYSTPPSNLVAPTVTPTDEYMMCTIPSDPTKLASLGLGTPIHISRSRPHTPNDLDSVDQNELHGHHQQVNNYQPPLPNRGPAHLPPAMRKVQNTDIERNMMGQDNSQSKSLQKDINLNGLPNCNSEKYYRSCEVIV